MIKGFLKRLFSYRSKGFGKETDLDKLSELCRFAEFGRLAAGLFHDLINLLTPVSLNVERARSDISNLQKTKMCLDQALRAVKIMERFITDIRKQMSRQCEEKEISLLEETRQVIHILSYKAEISHVELKLFADKKIVIFGNPILWSQVMLNLISNAVDSYDEIQVCHKKKEVFINIFESKGVIHCKITDRGSGIKIIPIKKIFEPFFTTKHGEDKKGMGIGLSIVKKIVEKDFHGSVSVKTSSHGTTFSLLIPKIKNSCKKGEKE